MTMDYRPLGDSGLMVSAVGLGCNAFSRRYLGCSNFAA